MFYFPGCTSSLARRLRCFSSQGFPIRTFSDQSLLGPSPKLIAATLRPSSPLSSQGIHHTLLFPLRKRSTTFIPLHRINLYNRLTRFVRTSRPFPPEADSDLLIT